MNRNMDILRLRKMRYEDGLNLAAIAEIEGVNRSTISRWFNKIDALRVPPSQADAPKPSIGEHQNQPIARDTSGRYVTKRFKRSASPQTQVQSKKISNRELFDTYLTEEFIAWIQEHEPRSFLDCWTRLQPKDSNINIGGSIDIEVAPYDPRIVEIQEVLSDGLGLREQMERIRQIVGVVQVIECKLVEIEEGGMAR